MAAFKTAALRAPVPGDDRVPRVFCCLACGDLLDGGWHAHHVVTQQHVRRADGDVWDPRNAMRLCTRCHGAHHSRQRPIPYSAVPPDAWDFATELLGQDGAEAFFARYYQPRRWVGY